MTYALLIYAGEERLDEAREERVLEAHRALQAESAAREQLHAVAQLEGTGTARTVRKTGGAYAVLDGPYMETKEWLVGFYLVDCDDEAEAIERAKQICPDGAHAVEVRPVRWRHES